jgi:hypothetical protein
MHSHRFRDQLAQHHDRLPRPAAPTPAPGSFFAFPLAWLDVATEVRSKQLWLYQQAFEQAQAVVRPSLPERRLLDVWN